MNQNIPGKKITTIDSFHFLCSKCYCKVQTAHLKCMIEPFSEISLVAWEH